jgi:hypothetical protein
MFCEQEVIGPRPDSAWAIVSRTGHVVIFSRASEDIWSNEAACTCLSNWMVEHSRVIGCDQALHVVRKISGALKWLMLSNLRRCDIDFA